MTIIEFFDPNAIHNALSLLLLSPTRVILFGEDAEQMYDFRLRLEKLISARKLKTRVQIMEARKKDYRTLINKLETLLLTYDDCVFDLTGGSAEALVAMGALSQKHGVPMHLSDPATCTITPFSGATAYPPFSDIRLSIREHATLYGGKMTESFLPPRDDSFRKDVFRVWDVCKKNPSRWNLAISALHALASPGAMGQHISKEEAKTRLSVQKADALFETLDALFHAGSFSSYRKSENNISFRFRSRAVLTAMEKEGSVLELYTYYAATGPADTAPFKDGAVGVMLDWDTVPAPLQKEDVKNEIDVFLMQGISPVLISCKNGYVDADELYKLRIVAARFGGKYAKCKIILTGHQPDLSFLARAKELDIQVIQNAHVLPFSVFTSLLQQSETANSRSL